MNYRICSRCVMDTTDPDIEFDDQGICNHCRKAEAFLRRKPFSLPISEKKVLLDNLVHDIKNNGIGKPYDCIIGLSGGVDSSYVAILVKELGLRPLAVHLDNGWNSELAVENIENICKSLDIDLYTHVIDWEEFKDLQLSFLKASTPDSEIPSDHAIFSLMYEMARKYKLKYLIAGTNLTSESILPLAWSQGYSDWRYIKSIHKQFGTKKLRTYPHRTLLRVLIDRLFVKWINILDYIDYDKEKAKKTISEQVGWRNYGRKHGESKYTKIFQEIILPEKFGFDKRRAHLSSLIVAGQISREAALELLREPLYVSEDQKNLDIEYLITKFGINREVFDSIMKSPPKTIHDYSNSSYSWYKRLLYGLSRFIRLIK